MINLESLSKGSVGMSGDFSFVVEPILNRDRK
jgi:hypothetical protein